LAAGTGLLAPVQPFAQKFAPRKICRKILRKIWEKQAGAPQRGSGHPRGRRPRPASASFVSIRRAPRIDRIRLRRPGPRTETKQKRTEHLPLSAQALILVTLIIETSDAGSPFLFPGNKPGQPLREIKKFWNAVMREAGITNYRRHDNRHTYASHLVSSGLSLEIVGRLLGHTTTTTTKRYAHLADDPLRAAADKFGSKIASFHR
jgi:integrase